ncbi:carbon-nitrogen hydrolase family protein [Belliella marina]|uniref:Carbon-nitrogen hydrolase family protein n=1 Tax=Belliella marina TaxID=1644146 RepID=A0ABW4VL80_9BACT
MKICIAQTNPIGGDISANIGKHKRLIDLAVSFGATSIFFPELSLTGYEPKLAKSLATDPDDGIFGDFQDISDKNKIVIALGMPTRTNSGIQIGMLLFQPEIPRQIYAKQLLHSDEIPYFVNGEKQVLITVKRKKIAPAICYESLQSDHSERAFNLGAEIYVASVAKSQRGIDKAMSHYPSIAKRFSMPVLMSNCIGYCDDFLSAGQSAVWDKNGKLVGQLDDHTEGFLIFNIESEKLIKQVI